MAGRCPVKTPICATCGFTSSGKTPAHVERAMRVHSCDRHLERAARRVRREAVESARDRAPKPCHHKRAQHQHGTRACYVLDACRCLPCARANAKAENERHRLKAYGRYDGYVDADPVREHLTALMAYGIGLKTVSKLSGISNGSITKIYYGTYASTRGAPSRGRYGAGDLLRGPSARVTRATREAILGVTAVPANLPPRADDHERTPHARLQLQALVALGWSMSRIGDRLGMKPGNLGRCVHGEQPMQRQTVDKIESLYAELSMTLPPCGDKYSRISVARSKRYARERGWRPPLDLELAADADLEDDAAHDFDEVAIERRLAGDKSARLTKPEAAEAVARWRATGRSLAECERVTGIKPNRFPAPRKDVAS